MITLRHIEVFHAVYQTGSLSGGARLLGVSQPSVSKVLRHAESQLGLPLFQVVKGRLVATDEAHRLFEEAAAVQERMATLLEAAANLRRSDHGRIRIATIHSLGLRIVPHAVARFCARFPHVSVEIRTCHTEDLADTLHARTADLAIGYDAARHPRLANLIVGTGELVILFRRLDIPDPPARMAIEDLSRFRMIQLINDGTIGGLLSRRIAAERADTARVAAKTYFVAAALVAEGMGIAVMDEFTARSCQTPELDLRPLDDPLRFDVVATHLEDRPLSTISQQFLEELRRSMTPRHLSAIT